MTPARSPLAASARGAACLVVVALLAPRVGAAADYYVSPTGDDSGAGTAAIPFRSIQKAADVMAAGDTCHIAGGVYPEWVRPAQSGASGQPISFVAEPDGAAVVLTGAQRITGWTVHSGSVWKASVGSAFVELFVDRRRMVLARWPNLEGGDEYRPTFLKSSADGGATSLVDTVNLVQPAGAWDGARLFLVPGLGWQAEDRLVASYDAAAHQIHFTEPINFSEYYGVDAESLYFLYDRLDLLDAPGEWYLDRAGGTVYLWLPGGGDPNDRLVEAPAGPGGFDLSDRAAIQVKGVTVFAGELDLTGATGCRIEDVRHLYGQPRSLDPYGASGVLVVTGADNVVERCEVAYAPGRCVFLGGTRNSLRASHVHHCDLVGAYNEIVTFAGRDTTVSDCSLHDAGRDGVNVLFNTDVGGSVLEHSEIFDTGLIAKDCGGFYVWNTDGHGMVLRYNVVHGMRPEGTPQYGGVALGMGIYFDDASSNFLVHHNVTYDTSHISLFLHVPSPGIKVYNNTTVGVGDGWAEPLGAHPGSHGEDTTGAEIANNLAVVLDNRDWCISLSGDTPPPYHHNGYFRATGDGYNSLGLEATAVVGDPLFTDAAGRDYSLQAGSPMIDQGVEIAGVTDGFAGAAPDLGAFEHGGSAQPGPRVTPGPAGCTPDCAGRECGPDPACGQSCGTCGGGETCSSAGRCEPSDGGSDGPGGGGDGPGGGGDGPGGGDDGPGGGGDGLSGACGCRATGRSSPGLVGFLLLAARAAWRASRGARRGRPGRGALARLVVVGALVTVALAGCGGEGAGPAADAAADHHPGDAPAAEAATPGVEAGVEAAAPPGDAGCGAQCDGPPPALDECASPAAGWIFCSGFEEGNKDVWDDYDDNPDETNLLLADPGPFGLAGNHVMRLRVPAGRGGADLVKVVDAHDRLYARWYVKWEAGFDFDAPNHGGGLHAGDRSYLGQSDYRPEGDDWFGSWIEYATASHTLQAYTYYRGMYQDCADPDGACWGDAFPCTTDEGQTYCTEPRHREAVMPPALVADRWYCVEMTMAGGTPTSTSAGADGELDFWVDGQEIGPWTDLWLRTSPAVKPGLLWLNLFHHGEHSVAGVMLDRVVVSTTRIGCGT
jgi:hypothetical protein